MLKLKFLTVLFFAGILCCCTGKYYPKAENALDAGREFIDGCLKGDFDKATAYMVNDETNKDLLLKQKKNYDAKTDKEKQQYKEQLEQLLEERTAEVDRLAYYDTITQLPNRTLFEDRLAQAVAVAKSKGQTLGVLFISLDQLKKVNDTLGHGRGDSLLREFGERLKSCISQTDTVARFGNDEFVDLTSPNR